MKRKLLRRLAQGVLAVTVEPLLAAESDGGGAVELSPVQVTASRIPQAVVDVPQPVTVVGREEIERGTPQVMTDLLRGQPGVFTQATGPGQGIAIVRGLKGSEVLHLVDGFRLNNAFFRSAPSQYIALVDPYNLSQIEVLRGPYGTLYGSDAMGGVIQLFTPEYRFSGPQPTLRGGIRTQLGSADLAKVVRGYFATGMEGFALSGGYTSMGYGARDTASGGRQHPTGYQARAYDAKAAWSGGGQDLMVNVQFFEVPQLPRYNEVVAGFDTDGNPGPEALYAFYEPNNRLLLHARYRYSVALPYLENVEVHLGRQILNDDRRSRDFSGSASNVEQRELNRSALSGFTVQAVSPAGVANRLVYGLELYRDEVSAARTDTNLGTGVSSAARARFPDGSHSDSVGLYVSDDWQPTARWNLSGGVRYSDVRTRLPANPPPGGTGIGVDVRNADVSGNLGMLYRLTPVLAWTLNLGGGFRAPNIFDLGTFGNRPGNRFNAPNSGLGAERVSTLDTGFKWLEGDLQGELSVFYTRYRERISSVPTGNRVGTRMEVQSRNIASAEYWGAESGVRYLLDPRLELYGTLNYTFGQEQLTPGAARSPANRVPPLNGQFGGVCRLSDWRLEPYLQFAARQGRLAPDSDGKDSRINPQGTAGWLAVNARVGWAAAESWRLQLDLRNLLDQAYREHGSGIDAPGRGAVLSVDARF